MTRRGYSGRLPGMALSRFGKMPIEDIGPPSIGPPSGTVPLMAEIPRTICPEWH